MFRKLAFVLFLIGLNELVIVRSEEFKLLMPKVSPKTKDSYLCIKKKLDPENPLYITEFLPHSSKKTVHHILVYGCQYPGTQEEVWNCGEMNSESSDNGYKSAPICRGQSSILFAWAMDAPKLVLPKDVAFKLGAGTKLGYLAMQVHYANVDKFQGGETDESGIVIVGQNKPVNYLAGVYLLVTAGHIRANSIENFESACEMQEETSIIPFAYRTHTHKLGQVNSGYVVRNDPIVGDEHQTWTEIGRHSPQLPQMFYPVTNNITIHKGDVLAARCTMENTRDHDVYVGATGDDEMCNFYVMYYTKSDLLRDNVCFTNGPPSWYFEDFRDSKGNGLVMSEIPANIDQVPKSQLEMLKLHNHSSDHEENMELYDDVEDEGEKDMGLGKYNDLANDELELDLDEEADDTDGFKEAQNNKDTLSYIMKLLYSRYSK